MEQELKHHGIIGQKWGKRNGPPYPLDLSDMSYAEKKASHRSKTADKINRIKEKDQNRSGRKWVRRELRRNKEAEQLMRDANGDVYAARGGETAGTSRASDNKIASEGYVGARKITSDEAAGIARLNRVAKNRTMYVPGMILGYGLSSINSGLNRDYISKLEPKEQTAILTEIGRMKSASAANKIVTCYRKIDRSAKSMTPAERDHYFDIIKGQLAGSSGNA